MIKNNLFDFIYIIFEDNHCVQLNKCLQQKFYFYRNVKHKNKKLYKYKEFILITYKLSTVLVLKVVYQRIYVVFCFCVYFFC